MCLTIDHQTSAVRNLAHKLRIMADFEKLTTATGCDDNAKAWLKTALDPFHDYDTLISGIPDNDSQNSVVQILNRIVTIAAPAGLDPGQTWSAHISVLPLASEVPCNAYLQDVVGAADSSTIRAQEGSGGVGWTMGTVTVVSQGTGKPRRAYDESWPDFTNGSDANNWSDATVGNETRQFRGVGYESDNTQSMKKLIAGGFEIHNDTAALYKQGSCTVYSSPMGSVPEPGAFADNSVTSTDHLMNFRKSRQPPISMEQAAQLPNSRTWEAAEGCYVPIRLGDHTDYEIARRSTFRTAQTDDSESLSFESGMVQFSPILTHEPYRYKHRAAELECTGAYFSGLSPETVLTLKTKFIVETAPSTANMSMLSMATPTPAYCPRALELYHQVIRKLPPGVMVKYNDKGDWFRSITAVIRDVAPMVAPFLAFRPGIAAALATAGSVAGGLNTVSQKHKDAKKKVQHNTARTTAKNVSSPNRRAPAATILRK